MSTETGKLKADGEGYVFIDKSWKLMDSEGNIFDEQGNIIRDKDGLYPAVEEQKRLVVELRKKVAWLRPQIRDWNDCSDLLPDTFRQVIAWSPELDESFPCYFLDGQFVDADKNSVTYEIDLWQEWPKDPEPGAEEKERLASMNEAKAEYNRRDSQGDR